jgi:tyrosine aminotransferase
MFQTHSDSDCSGLAKEFILPGWRVGWIVIHDKGTGRLAELRVGIKNLTQIVLGANSLIQAAIPRVLCPEKDSEDEASLKAFHDKYMDILRSNALLCKSAALECPELTVIEPMGAMYVMIGVDIDSLDGVTDDADFAKQLLTEENLFLLPGQCFGMKNYVRLVTCPPVETILEAFARLKLFCDRHRTTAKKEEIVTRERGHSQVGRY